MPDVEYIDNCIRDAILGSTNVAGEDTIRGPELCNDVPTSEINGINHQEYCLYIMAKALRDPSICDMSNNKMRCYKELGEIGEMSVCEDISDSEGRRNVRKV